MEEEKGEIVTTLAIDDFDHREPFRKMYEMKVREDGYQGTYDQFTRETMDRINNWGLDTRTPVERRLAMVKDRIGSAHERGWVNSAHPDKADVKKKKKRRKAVMKKHRR